MKDFILRQLADELIGEARCAACGRRPDRTRRDIDAAADAVIFTVSCHGAFQRLSLSRADLGGVAWKTFIASWRNLFAEHGHPDVKELLKYNREPWSLAA